ncbi:hypothetical protein ACIQVU_07860 [Lysinibacillus sp. NPDC098008]|uniref:hypothetical protein n=1 Tax=Lysinibacillus sp. NPDC098008 TaxID=3364146 RepID=UPI0038015655
MQLVKTYKQFTDLYSILGWEVILKGSDWAVLSLLVRLEQAIALKKNLVKGQIDWNQKAFDFYITDQHIADLTGLHIKSIGKIISNLEELGLISAKYRVNSKKATEYTIVKPVPLPAEIIIPKFWTEVIFTEGRAEQLVREYVDFVNGGQNSKEKVELEKRLLEAGYPYSTVAEVLALDSFLIVANGLLNGLKCNSKEGIDTKEEEEVEPTIKAFKEFLDSNSLDFNGYKSFAKKDENEQEVILEILSKSNLEKVQNLGGFIYALCTEDLAKLNERLVQVKSFKGVVKKEKKEEATDRDYYNKFFE